MAAFPGSHHSGYVHIRQKKAKTPFFENIYRSISGASFLCRSAIQPDHKTYDYYSCTAGYTAVKSSEEYGRFFHTAT